MIGRIGQNPPIDIDIQSLKYSDPDPAQSTIGHQFRRSSLARYRRCKICTGFTYIILQDAFCDDIMDL